MSLTCEEEYVFLRAGCVATNKSFNYASRWTTKSSTRRQELVTEFQGTLYVLRTGTMPRLTVIMPAKNAQATIRLAITSTLKAMPRDSELRVWNDGSDDNTLSVADSVSDSRLVVVNSDQSVGSGKARALMIEQSDSHLIANMDADDYCLPWRFVLQNIALKSTDMSFTSFIRFGSSPPTLRPSRPANYQPRDTALALAFHNPLSHTSMTATRESLERCGGYRDLRVAQDYDLWLRATTAGVRLSVEFIPAVAYRISATQISSSTTYAKQVTTSAELEQSYLNLLDYLSPGAKAQVDSSDRNGRAVIIRSIRHDILSQFMSIRHRKYYKNLLERNLAGPFGEKS